MACLLALAALHTLASCSGDGPIQSQYHQLQESPMPTTPKTRRWLRKFWGAVCVIAGLVSIAAGLESTLLE